MARSAPVGISAQIIQFPNSAPAPVQQRRGPGRHPKMVTQLWKYRNKKSITKPRMSPEYMRGIESGMRAAGQLSKNPMRYGPLKTTCAPPSGCSIRPATNQI